MVRHFGNRLIDLWFIDPRKAELLSIIRVLILGLWMGLPWQPFDTKFFEALERLADQQVWVLLFIGVGLHGSYFNFYSCRRQRIWNAITRSMLWSLVCFTSASTTFWGLVPVFSLIEVLSALHTAFMVARRENRGV